MSASTGSPVGFPERHLGADASAVARMVERIGVGSVEELIDTALPRGIRDDAGMQLPAAASEQEVTAALRALAQANMASTAMIGLGYYATITPPVVRRNVLESPSWYTAYTPYQPEISQGRLEALLNFQTLVGDLTGLPTANASLLDEATALRCAERMNLELKLLEPFKGLALCLPVGGTGGIDIAALHRHIAEHAPAERLEGGAR